MEHVSDNNWFENVQLEMPIASSNCGGYVVTENLAADHGNGFTLSRVDLSGHD